MAEKEVLRDKFSELSMFTNDLRAIGEEAVRKCMLLVDSARSGDLNTLTNLIKEGVSVNGDEFNKLLFYNSHNYVTPLQAACEANQLACVRYLMDHGADVNCRDKFDVSAVHVAAEKGFFEVLRELLEAGAECNVPTKYSKNGCYTAVPHIGGTLPLHLAATYNHVDCVVELIQFGADYNAVDQKGRNSLYICAELGYAECVLAHLKNAIGRDILSLPSYETGDTPLHFAVMRSMVECVEELLHMGSDPNHLNFYGVSPLHCAVNPSFCQNSEKAFQVMKLLVLKGHNIDINQKDGSGNTPLHYVAFNSRPGGRACFMRRPNWAEFLIQYGADPLIMNQMNCSLVESEISSPVKDTSILDAIVQSLGHPPDMKSWKVPAPTVHLHSPFRTHLEDFDLEMHPNQIATQEKLRAYIVMTSGPRTLQHYCRCSIRNALGHRRMRHIKDLTLPTHVQNYLLLMTKAA